MPRYVNGNGAVVVDRGSPAAAAAPTAASVAHQSRVAVLSTAANATSGRRVRPGFRLLGPVNGHITSSRSAATADNRRCARVGIAGLVHAGQLAQSIRATSALLAGFVRCGGAVVNVADRAAAAVLLLDLRHPAQTVVLAGRGPVRRIACVTAALVVRIGDRRDTSEAVVGCIGQNYTAGRHVLALEVVGQAVKVRRGHVIHRGRDRRFPMNAQRERVRRGVSECSLRPGVAVGRIWRRQRRGHTRHKVVGIITGVRVGVSETGQHAGIEIVGRAHALIQRIAALRGIRPGKIS